MFLVKNKGNKSNPHIPLLSEVFKFLKINNFCGPIGPHTHIIIDANYSITVFNFKNIHFLMQALYQIFFILLNIRHINISNFKIVSDEF